ncbi:ATP-grasp domain-containing protein [bacterium]|nr:MAG: ATP-grasp domain-containing protein [bacterium]
MRRIIVVNQEKDWIFKHIKDVEVVIAKDYLLNQVWADAKNVQVFNLSKSYSYQTKGYYVSLLAEARNHKVIPSVTTIQDMKSKSVVKVLSNDLNELIQKSLKNIKADEFVLSIYFGNNLAAQHQKLARELYNLFRAPFLRARFKRIADKWILQTIVPIASDDIPDNHIDFLQEKAVEYFKRDRYFYNKKDTSVYDLAILQDPTEKAPPSNKKALDKFISVAENMDFYVDLITKDDYARVGEYDALFIRETTSVNHYTYRFARRADAEGMVVMDDPISIMRCANKVYLNEALTIAKVPIPKTVILQNDKTDELIKQIGLPCVLKVPDSSFSLGVKKAETESDLKNIVTKMLDESDLIIAQKYMYSPFDWRVGVIDGQPLYVCKYFMARGHWQIYDWSAKKNQEAGEFETLAVENAPKHIVETAVRATKLIGNGLYGVDIKEIDGKAYVIEINDNPNIDAGVEDKVIGDAIYETIIGSFKKRLDHRMHLKNK